MKANQLFSNGSCDLPYIFSLVGRNKSFILRKGIGKTFCSGLKMWNLAIALQPNLHMMVRHVCCMPRGGTAIGPSLGFWKFHRTSHNSRASRARCYLLNFLLMYGCRDFVLIRRSFICKGLKWQGPQFPTLRRLRFVSLLRCLICRKSMECLVSEGSID